MSYHRVSGFGQFPDPTGILNTVTGLPAPQCGHNEQLDKLLNVCVPGLPAPPCPVGQVSDPTGMFCIAAGTGGGGQPVAISCPPGQVPDPVTGKFCMPDLSKVGPLPTPCPNGGIPGLDGKCPGGGQMSLPSPCPGGGLPGIDGKCPGGGSVLPSPCPGGGLPGIDGKCPVSGQQQPPPEPAKASLLQSPVFWVAVLVAGGIGIYLLTKKKTSAYGGAYAGAYGG